MIYFGTYNSEKEGSDALTAGDTVIGILAHIDAGKTTLSEQILFKSGVIRKVGKVDNRDTCLDFFDQERSRGITIFSKQTSFCISNRKFTLIDTPGHADFAAETERALSVLDAAVLVVDGVEGVQARTEIWWELLRERNIPVFVFVGKNDREQADRKRVYKEIKEKLGTFCFDFTTPENEESAFEDTVSQREEWLEAYLEGNADKSLIALSVSEGRTVPVVFGSSLTGDGVDRLCALISDYAPVRDYPETFSAKVYKVSRDSKGDRVTYMKITGGILNVRDVIGEEKINQIRIYSGEKASLVPSVAAGAACAVTGLSETYPGQVIGNGAKGSEKPVFSPSLLSTVTSDNTDNHTLAVRMYELTEEMPELSVSVRRIGEEEVIQIGVMGRIQLEVLTGILMNNYGISVTFGPCRIMYKETVAAPVMGYGHYEPLKHYAEVHLRIEPAERGSGVIADTECSLEVLDRNYQNLVLTHIKEKEHIGILTGSPLTDVRIVLTAGRSHLKHKEGGDFLEAAYRAVRQGLEKADNVLLEPYYSYTLRIPQESIGRAINDLQKMCCEFEAPETDLSGAVIKGNGPVATLIDYAEEVASYTGGRGSIIFRDVGYKICHNPDEVIEETGYEKERDLNNTSSSVFCSHGAGYEVKWQDVDAARHIK